MLEAVTLQASQRQFSRWTESNSGLKLLAWMCSRVLDKIRCEWKHTPVGFGSQRQTEARAFLCKKSKRASV